MMLKNKALLLCMFSLIMFYSCNNNHENLWNEAKQLYSDNDHENSIKKLHQIIDKYPNSGTNQIPKLVAITAPTTSKNFSTINIGAVLEREILNLSFKI